MDREKLLPLLAAAALRHGHTCPSLLYGCRMAAMLLERIPAGAEVATLTIRHSSSCLRDGAETVLATRPALLPAVVSAGGDCSLEASWGEGSVRVAVRARVREKVNLLKAARDLESFRQAGVEWLLGLADEEFAEITVGRGR